MVNLSKLFTYKTNFGRSHNYIKSYVHTTPFQKDPFERHIGGGRFLVKLRKVKNSENFLRMSSIVKENINFWEEEVFINNDLKETVLKIEKGDITNNEREF